MNVPQEVDDWFNSLNSDEVNDMAFWAFKHAIDVGSMTPEALSGFILAEFIDLYEDEDQCASGHTV
jgi:hypothetical protein